MVFESVVADVLNRFLGDYVENLDTSQLKIGIWGGDVVLENLILKENALEELNIPVQTVYGHLGKLVLKIPWKNLYGASVEATIENLFLIVNPTVEVKYNAEKEKKQQLASKQAELQRVEEAKRQEAQKDQKVDDSFVEKLVTQIIKNVQLKIKDIHIRYEDSITNPAEPFSCGVTLHNLSVHTTDDSWKQTVIQEAVTKIFKILDLVGLAVYLNPSTKLYAKMSKEEILSRMQQEIATKSSQANDFNYVLGPINSTAKLKLNPKPELDSPKFSIPKCILSLHMEQLTVCINKEQYQDIMKLADSMDRMSKGKPYRKYRPFLNKYKGHYKEWWKFAYTCVVEEDVRRRRKNWDWAHMLNHRTTCRDYALAYQNKLTCKGKVAKDQIALLEHCENKLDIFNLVVIRQRIELEVERLGKAQEEANKNKGWFRSWWGGSSTKDDELSENTAIMKQFEKAMTPEEKSKLFRAIDYQENSAPTHLPAQFVALECHFSLDRLAVAVTDKEKQVLLSELENVQLSIEQRPSADAIKVGVIMQEFTVLGVKQGLLTPKIVGSQLSTQSAANGFNLLNVTFETNPLSNDCGQRLQVSARPLRIVYDAQTVIEIVNVFQTPPDSTALKELQAVAGSKLSNLKEKSTLGMEHAVSQHAYIDLDIHLQSSYIVIPHGGLFTKEMSEACLVVNLGAISIKSEPRSQSALNVHSMHKEGLCDDEILKQVLDNTYDKFVLNLTDMQVLIAAKEEDWLTTIMSGDISPQHLLQPTTLRIQIHKCLITDDPRLPNMKVRGELEKIAITASEDRLLTLLELFVAMPLPESKPTPVLKRAESKGSNLSLFRYLDPAEKKKPLERSPLQNEQAVQLTLLDANFVMNDFIINICRKSTDSTTYDRMLEFTLETLEIQATQKTYTMDTLMRLGSLSLVHHRPDCKPIHVIETQLTNQSAISSLQERYLFTVSYTNVDKRSPDFRSHYCSVEQLIVLNFTTLRVLLHLEALQQLLVVANDYQNRISAVQGQKDRIASAGSPLPTIMEDQELTTIKSKASTVSKSTRSRKVETIQLKVKIKVDEVDICFETEERPLAEISWQGLHAGLIMKDSYKQIEASIEDMRVLDMNPKTMHKEILKIIGGNVLTVNIVLYNLAEYPDVSDTDISITAQINCMRIIFLNWFVTSMLEFLSNFQTAQQAIIDASAVAADAAKANLQSAYENSIKVSLSVELKAPIIVAPENSNSFDALMIDLGRMTLRNKFFTLDVPESKVNPVIVDELTLVLTNMKISCVSFSDAQYETRQETMLLQPTSFTLFVKRSLSSWFDPLPDLDVSGRLKSIEITIRQSDFKMIMRMLQENLTEGQINAGKPTSALPSGTKLTPKVSSASTSLSAKATSPCLVQASVEIRKAKAPRTKIKFSFAMDSLIIDLKNTMSVSKKIHNVPHTSMEDVGLARFGLSVLSVKGRMLSDESMHTSVLLVDCTLDDTRPHRGSRITRYLNRKPEPGFSLVDAPESSDKIRSMIDITYTQKPSDTFIDVRVYSFNLILAMDLLMRVLDFTTSSITPDVPSGDGQLTAKPSVKGRPSETSLKKKTTNAVVNEVSNAKKSMMTINIKVEKPDITLVESLEKKNCEALIMNMEIAFKMRMTQDRMVVDGSVSSLQLYTRVCTESNEGEVLQDDGQRRYVLEPCHLSLAAAQPEGAGMHVDIAVSDIKIVVSPATINLLNRVVATMTNSEEDTGENKNEIITYDDLWGKKSFDSNKYWFLTADVADDAILLEESSSVILKKWVSGEICMLSSPNIVLALEMSVGSESIPMLVMESSLQAQVKDWSSKLYLESTWSMQMSYYNIAKAVWEPLIEPVETLRDNKYTHTPWELRIEVQMSSNDDADLMRTLSLPDPTMSSVDTLGSTQTLSKTASKTVTISSSEPLEITATSTALDVLQQLGSSYSEATSPLQSDLSVLDKSSKTSQIMKYSGAPYVLHNNTGLTVCLRLKEGGDFSVYTSLKGGRPISTDYREVVLELGASVPLQLKHGALNLLSINANLPALQLYIQIKELSCELLIPVERADKRYFPLGAERNSTSDVAGQESRGIISEVTMHEGAINIYLRSVVQVRNTLLVGVTVYYMTASGNEVVSLGEVSPGDTMQLPLHAVHTPTAEIFFSVEGFTVSVSPFVWRDLQHEVKIAKLLHCESKDRTSSENAYIRVVGTMEQVYLEDTSRHTLASACFNIELRPAVLLQNCLPVDVQVSQVGHNRTQTYRPGEMFHLSFLSPTKADLIILLPNYLEKCWSCTSRLPDLNTEFSVWSFDSHDSPAKMTLDLGIHCINEDGTQKLSLYCPFWMLNKTGFSLAYRKSRKSESEKASNTPRKADDTGNVLYHPVDYKGPILFSFRAKNFFGKKKASIRIEYGDWCDKFSLDVAGSSGVVLCRNEGRVYQVAVHNHLTFNSLTKMVIFTPFFLIVNSAPFDIECQEQGRLGDAWLKVEKNSSTAHWPLSERDEKLLIVRVAGTTQVAAPFVYTEQHTTLLKLNNEYGGIQVETQLSEGGSYITLRQYRDGLAPALIVNYSRHEVIAYEKENVNVRKVPPMHNMLFTWDNPAGPRILIFEGYKKKEIENDLRKDGVGRFLINSDTNVYWVSFLDGMQRVILFTDDVLLAENAHTAGESGALDMEVTVAIHGVGLSLVNNHERQEILYISISNSGIIWERCKAGSRRFKRVDTVKAAMLEEAYQHYVQECQVAKSVVPGRVMLDNFTEVDFENMLILKPHPKTLRRMLEPGLWLSLGISAHRRQLHARLHRLQIDQQMPLPTFPVILAPVPPPRSVASEQNMKPFVEVSVVERIMEHTSVKQYKYFKLLVQEFHVKVDMGLVTALINMFPPKQYTPDEALEAFAMDLQAAERALEDYAAEGMANDQKHFYDNLHLSPLKVHVSFSMGSSTQIPTFVGTLLQSIGVTLTDMNDVIFKLGYYERNYEFLSQKELILQVSAHYTGQALQQLYVLVLGLDVLGNPYGLVIGLKKGVEDLFYEPFQGAIQGPGEFAEGLYLGVRSLLGHTVGGAAGAISRITGAMGHGLAALTLDDNYQKRRRDQLNKPPANLQEGLARSGKGLVMGVFDGVTGVFTKPITGAREQGVEGFFKGLGKGAVGLVARPTAGVVDFASGSLDAVKRAADISEDVLRHRPPRCFPSDGVVRPYSRQQAEGLKLLNDFEKGKYVSTDTYVTHVWVISKKELVLCTDKRIIAMERSSVFGSWQLQWTYLWQEIPDFPVLVERGLYIPTAKKKMMGLFSNNSSGKILIIYDEAQRSHLHATCHGLMRQAR